MLKRAAIERSIPRAPGRWDVIVAGGGPAGIGAAPSTRAGSRPTGTRAPR